LIEGEITVTYRDGQEETVKAGDLFHWPSGHSVRVGRDAEVILFSPLAEHAEVIDHMTRQMQAAA
jgi:quercetin dioxygenase-like cupin family protein